MNFKQWLINEVLDDVATKDTSNIEIHKKENTGGQQPSYIHNFEKDGYNYQISLDHDILPVNQTTKLIFPELENVKKDKISGYSINLYGPNLTIRPTGLSGIKAFDIYEILLLTMRKIIEDPQYPPAEMLSYMPTETKMIKIYKTLFKRFFPNYQKLNGTHAYLRKDLLQQN